MKKLLVIVTILAVPLMALPLASAGSGHDMFRPLPPPRYCQPQRCSPRRLAASCLLEGMKAGAFHTMNASELALYCREAAKIVCDPDVTPDPEF